MSEQHYATPKADLSVEAQQSINPKRTATTVWGIIFLIMGLLGLAISIFGFIAVTSLEMELPGFDRSTLEIDAVLSIVSKFGLLGLSIGLLSRGAWVKPMVYIGLVLSLIDTIFKGIVIIPIQASQAVNEAQSVGVYGGFYGVAGISLAIYIAMIFYLRGDASKREFEFE